VGERDGVAREIPWREGLGENGNGVSQFPSPGRGMDPTDAVLRGCAVGIGAERGGVRPRALRTAGVGGWVQTRLGNGAVLARWTPAGPGTNKPTNACCFACRPGLCCSAWGGDSDRWAHTRGRVRVN
jgi:hypothetical protein